MQNVLLLQAHLILLISFFTNILPVKLNLCIWSVSRALCLCFHFQITCFHLLHLVLIVSLDVILPISQHLSNWSHLPQKSLKHCLPCKITWNNLYSSVCLPPHILHTAKLFLSTPESHTFLFSAPVAAVRPDLTKFRHFGKSLQVFSKFMTVYFLFGKMMSLLWQTCDIIGLIFIVANGQILKKNLTNWSHCSSNSRSKAQSIFILDLPTLHLFSLLSCLNLSSHPSWHFPKSAWLPPHRPPPFTISSID